MRWEGEWYRNRKKVNKGWIIDVVTIVGFWRSSIPLGPLSRNAKCTLKLSFQSLGRHSTYPWIPVHISWVSHLVADFHGFRERRGRNASKKQRLLQVGIWAECMELSTVSVLKLGMRRAFSTNVYYSKTPNRAHFMTNVFIKWHCLLMMKRSEIAELW